MKPGYIFTVSVVWLFLQFGAQAQNTLELFNGKDLEGWQLQVDPKSTVSPEEVFGVKDGLIHIGGQPFGYMYTSATYENFHLYVEWRYIGKGTNSGIFLFVQEPKFWPNAIECQLQSGRAGDILKLGGANIEKSPGRENLSMFNPSQENPVGEWNNADITCENGNITVFINGTLQNRAFNSANKNGHVALQSEGGPIEFRHVRLTPLK